MDWVVRHSCGDAAAFHAADPQPVRSATFHRVDRPTLVLGSAQRPDAADARVAAALGVSVISRRSGGGAVLLLPGEFVWLDLVVPAGDPLWLDDVGAAMHWAGGLWRDALAGLGVAGTVHTGALRSAPWSRDVCFVSVGAGEVLAADGRKLVGVSQRRTRGWARLQTMCHLRWRPEVVAALVAAPRPTAADIAAAAAIVPAPEDEVVAALVERLRSV